MKKLALIFVLFFFHNVYASCEISGSGNAYYESVEILTGVEVDPDQTIFDGNFDYITYVSGYEYNVDDINCDSDISDVVQDSLDALDLPNSDYIQNTINDAIDNIGIESIVSDAVTSSVNEAINNLDTPSQQDIQDTVIETVENFNYTSVIQPLVKQAIINTNLSSVVDELLPTYLNVPIVTFTTDSNAAINNFSAAGNTAINDFNTTVQTHTTNAQNSATAAQNSAIAAGNSATAAQTSLIVVQNSATAAQNSATAAQTSLIVVQNSATAAQNSATAAQTSANNSLTSFNTISISLDSSIVSATNALNSSNLAEGYAIQARHSATSAADSDEDFRTFTVLFRNATNEAVASAVSAAGSATSAAGSATSAENSATAAGGAATTSSENSTAAENSAVFAEAFKNRSELMSREAFAASQAAQAAKSLASNSASSADAFSVSANISATAAGVSANAANDVTIEARSALILFNTDSAEVIAHNNAVVADALNNMRTQFLNTQSANRSQWITLTDNLNETISGSEEQQRTITTNAENALAESLIIQNRISTTAREQQRHINTEAENAIIANTEAFRNLYSSAEAVFSDIVFPSQVDLTVSNLVVQPEITVEPPPPAEITITVEPPPPAEITIEPNIEVTVPENSISVEVDVDNSDVVAELKEIKKALKPEDTTLLPEADYGILPSDVSRDYFKTLQYVSNQLYRSSNTGTVRAMTKTFTFSANLRDDAIDSSLDLTDVANLAGRGGTCPFQTFTIPMPNGQDISIGTGIFCTIARPIINLGMIIIVLGLWYFGVRFLLRSFE